MSITCKIGRYFSDINAAKECARSHPGGCAQHNETDYYIPQRNNIKQPEEISTGSDTIFFAGSGQPNNKKSSIANPNECPAHKNTGFPCPRCFASVTISETGYFFKTTTFWECKYPMIVNLHMLTPEDILNFPTEP
jgi:hypothetical protein